MYYIIPSDWDMKIYVLIIPSDWDMKIYVSIILDYMTEGYENICINHTV